MMFPPGRGRLFTSPALTASLTVTSTIGMVLVTTFRNHLVPGRAPPVANPYHWTCPTKRDRELPRGANS